MTIACFVCIIIIDIFYGITAKEKAILAKNKKNGLSMAIVALNIVIVLIIILIIGLVYLHMKEDTGNSRPENPLLTSTAPPVSDETQGSVATEGNATASETSPAGEVTDETSGEETSSEENTQSIDDLLIPQYDRAFFDNDLFIGDSISTGLHLYGYLNADNVFAEVGLNPESAVTREIDGVTCIQKAGAMQPKHIYIMLGTNGLAYMSGEYMAGEMLDLIAELEMACPTAQICVVSIPPVTKEYENEEPGTLEKISDYNSRLSAFCQQGGYTYIDICSKMKDDDGYFSSKYAEDDGMHFLGGAYALMLGTIEQQIG